MLIFLSQPSNGAPSRKTAHSRDEFSVTYLGETPSKDAQPRLSCDRASTVNLCIQDAIVEPRIKNTFEEERRVIMYKYRGKKLFSIAKRTKGAFAFSQGHFLIEFACLKREGKTS